MDLNVESTDVENIIVKTPDEEADPTHLKKAIITTGQSVDKSEPNPPTLEGDRPESLVSVDVVESKDLEQKTQIEPGLLPIEKVEKVQELPASQKFKPGTKSIRNSQGDTSEVKNSDEKLSIYKALAIKLKKELVKSRDELNRLRSDYDKDVKKLQTDVDNLEKTLSSERHTSSTAIAALEAKLKRIEHELKGTENELDTLRIEFENYKVKASQIMQQSTTVQSTSNKTFEEERYRQLKQLTDEQKKRISLITSHLNTSEDKNKELENEVKLLNEQLDIARREASSKEAIHSKLKSLVSENENLKMALKQYRTSLKKPAYVVKNGDSEETKAPLEDTLSNSTSPLSDNPSGENASSNRHSVDIEPIDRRHKETQDLSVQLSPTTSVKEGSPINSNSSSDDNSSGYVHIKPAPFEIISKSSLFDEAHNQIENLTKAYLDSETTNALLTEQVTALKEEIRRLQRGSERLELADNLEYLKNIVFNFLSLDSNQAEKKQRLIPVLSTVLRLSPDETAKLSSLAATEKPGVASSFFKFS